MEERAKLEERVRQEVNAPKNASLLQDILEKMGRVLAKKRGLNAEKPRLVYDDRLWLGNFAFANDKNFLKEQEISTVISCLEVAPSQKVQGIEYKECYLKGSQSVTQMAKMQGLKQYLRISIELCRRVREIFMFIAFQVNHGQLLWFFHSL